MPAEGLSTPDQEKTWLLSKRQQQLNVPWDPPGSSGGRRTRLPEENCPVGTCARTSAGPWWSRLSHGPEPWEDPRVHLSPSGT